MRAKEIITVAVLLIGISLADNPPPNTKIWNETSLDILKRDLFMNYDKFSLPMHKNKTTDIVVGMSINHVDIDELKGVLTVYGWVNLQWYDDKFQWNPLEYGNVTNIHAASHEIWHPDLLPMNSAVGGNIDHFGDTLSLIFNNSLTLWVPPCQLNVFCNLNLRNWPFDTQTCNIKLGSWRLDEMGGQLENGTIDTKNAYLNINEWEVTSVVATKEKDSFYSYINVEVTLARRTALYKATITVPASCIIIMALASFWLPPQAGEKILLNGVVIIMICGFLMYFAQLLPVLAQNTPLVVLFYSSSLVLVSISMIISVLVLYLSSTNHSRRLPQFWKHFLDGSIGSILCLSHFSPDPNQPDQPDKELQEHNSSDVQTIIVDFTNSGKRSVQFDWIILATAIDRVFFFAYCLIFTTLAIVYSI